MFLRRNSGEYSDNLMSAGHCRPSHQLIVFLKTGFSIIYRDELSAGRLGRIFPLVTVLADYHR